MFTSQKRDMTDKARMAVSKMFTNIMFGDFQRRREGDVNLTRDSDSRDLAQPHFISLALHVIEASMLNWLTTWNCL